MIDEIIKEHAQRIESEKLKIVKARILERVGIELDLEAEAKRMFPRIVGLVNHGVGVGYTQSYYWNDGSEFGLFLVEFYLNEPEFKNNPESMSMQINLKYK